MVNSLFENSRLFDVMLHCCTVGHTHFSAWLSSGSAWGCNIRWSLTEVLGGPLCSLSRCNRGTNQMAVRCTSIRSGNVETSKKISGVTTTCEPRIVRLSKVNLLAVQKKARRTLYILRPSKYLEKYIERSGNTPIILGLGTLRLPIFMGTWSIEVAFYRAGCQPMTY